MPTFHYLKLLFIILRLHSLSFSIYLIVQLMIISIKHIPHNYIIVHFILIYKKHKKKHF